MTCNYRAVLQRLSLSSLRMGDGSCLSALNRPQAFLKSEPSAAVRAAATRESENLQRDDNASLVAGFKGMTEDVGDTL